MSTNIVLEKIINQQKEMNKNTYKSINEKGLDLQSKKIRIEFFFYSESEDNINNLEKVIYNETDYDIKKYFNSEIKEWVIVGKTQETQISLDILDDWVEWMCIVGYNNSCDFDGWGIEI